MPKANKLPVVLWNRMLGTCFIRNFQVSRSISTSISIKSPINVDDIVPRTENNPISNNRPSWVIGEEEEDLYATACAKEANAVILSSKRMVLKYLSQKAGCNFKISFSNFVI